MKIVHEWLSELVREIPDDVETVAREISLRGFEVASVEDGVIDFEITANRPDCLNHVGIAREAAVIWSHTPIPRLDASFLVPGGIPVAIDAPDLCPRYAAQVFDITVGPSPAWLAARLEKAGVRSINNIVDVTNYVNLELGQPLHAFDLDKVGGAEIVVRRAKKGEKLKTLDNLYQILRVDQTNRTMILLEAMIVLLFIIDLILLFTSG